MSKSGKELLLGWLMDGTGGEPMGAGLGMGGEEYSKKGRVAVMRVLNNRMDIQGNTPININNFLLIVFWCSHFRSLSHSLSECLGRVNRSSVNTRTTSTGRH